MFVASREHRPSTTTVSIPAPVEKSLHFLMRKSAFLCWTFTPQHSIPTESSPTHRAPRMPNLSRTLPLTWLPCRLVHCSLRLLTLLSHLSLVPWTPPRCHLPPWRQTTPSETPITSPDVFLFSFFLYDLKNAWGWGQSMISSCSCIV